MRRNAADAVSATLRPGLVLGVRTDNGAVFVRGAEPPTSALTGLDADTVAGAGSDGQTREAFGHPYLFFSFPLLGSDKEARAQGMLVVGGPLLPEGTADQVALESGLAALGLVQAGKLVSSGGPEKTRLPEALRETPVGKSAVVARGPARLARLLRLPLFANGPEPGAPGRAPPQRPRILARGAGAGEHRAGDVRPRRHPAVQLRGDALPRRRAGCPLAVDGSGRPACARAHPQEDTEPGIRRRRGLFGLGPSQPPVFRAPEARTEVAEPHAAAPARGARPHRARGRAECRPRHLPRPWPSPLPTTVCSEPGRPVSRPGTTSLRCSTRCRPADPTPPPIRPPSQRLSPSPATPPRPVPPKPPPAPEPLDYDHQPTTAYPVPNLPDFNLPPASALGPAANAIPEATRVQDVSADLLASSRVSGPRPLPLPKAGAPDEVHFQDVFHEFLAVRERCGEGGDGLTFEKFAGKLRKNRDQLVQKYGCRTVRFQVYVKDGRAALKATPVRD